MSIPPTSIIGLGALGGTLARAFSALNIPIKSVFNRSDKAVLGWAKNKGITTGTPLPCHKDQLGPLVFITVPDDAIADVVDHLQQLSSGFSNTLFVHCSGNESADILEPLQRKGAEIASMHPLQTFNKSSEADAFRDIYFSLQGDPGALAVLREVAQKLDSRAIEVSSRQKAHLHAAAVMASNYLMTLIDDSAQITSLSGLGEKEVKEMLQPLVMKSIKNIAEKPFSQALSGPIARSDSGTVEKHLDLLKDNPNLKKEYIQLGLRTVDKAREAGRLTTANAGRLIKLLKEAL